jgi:hypothetical protein
MGRKKSTQPARLGAQKRVKRVRREGKADAKAGDISARRGGTTDKITTPPDLSEMVNGFELFKGSQASVGLSTASCVEERTLRQKRVVDEPR